ncbi:hypothetical protein D3C79_368360 [compost metagenome]
MNVDLLVRQVELLHGGQGDHGKGFVDLEQVDLGQIPASALHQFVDSADRRRGEQCRRVGEGSVPMDHSQGRQTALLRLGAAHEHQCRSAVGDRTGVGGSYGAALSECRLELRDLVQARLGRLFVVLDQALFLAFADLYRNDLGAEAAFADRLLGAGQRGDGELVLGLAAEPAGLGAILGKGAHQAALVVGIFQAVHEHVVDDPAVAHAVAATGLVQQVGRIGHAFHATSHHHISGAGQQQVMGHDRRLHARTAHLVQGGAGGVLVQPGAQRGLARRCLALACRQHAAEQHLLDTGGIDAGALDGTTDGGAAQLRRGQALEVALQAAHGRAHGADDDDRIIGKCHVLTPYLAAMRSAPSRRITSPLSMLFSMI